MKKLALLLLAGLLWLGANAPATSQSSVFVPATTATIPVVITTATTTLLVTGVVNQRVYVTAIDIVAAGTGNIQFIAGTGATCGTGTVNITGNYNLTAQTGFSKGTGNGAVWALPLGFSLCAVTSAAVGMPGSIAYAIF
jgi:hypothetical protein